jgi:hypothetical protein
MKKEEKYYCCDCGRELKHLTNENKRMLKMGCEMPCLRCEFKMPYWNIKELILRKLGRKVE